MNINFREVTRWGGIIPMGALPGWIGYVGLVVQLTCLGCFAYLMWSEHRALKREHQALVDQIEFEHERVIKSQKPPYHDVHDPNDGR